MQAIVVTWDRLATRLVGCYGNEWIETPHLDRFAAESTVFDNHFADSVGRHRGEAWLTGRHSLKASFTGTPQLGTLLQQAGIATRLITADPDSPIPWTRAGFGEVRQVTGTNGLEVTPAEVPFARLVQAGIGMLNDPTAAADRRLIWLHAPEPGLPPEGFATLYFEDFEERGMPQEEIPRDQWSQQIAVAAGSMSLVDYWLGELLAQIHATRASEPTLVVFAAARGRSWMEDYLTLGPSHRADSPVNRLRDQELKSPLVLSVLGDKRYTELAGLRTSRFVQTQDLASTLLDWFQIPTTPGQFEGRSLLWEPISDEPGRDMICFGDDETSLGIRTLDWSCLLQLNSPDQAIPVDVSYGDQDWPAQVQLYSKPEDIWDVTDQATQQPEVCEELVRRLSSTRTRI
jgi:arylsulfatase A-like enzyme